MERCETVVECEICECLFVPGGKDVTTVCAACWRDQAIDFAKFLDDTKEKLLDVVSGIGSPSAEIVEELSEFRQGLMDSGLSVWEKRGLQGFAASIEGSRREVERSKRAVCDIINGWPELKEY